MNHSEIEKNNIIERYLLHELTEKEVTLFEEHLLFCDNCLKELENTKLTLDLLKKSAYVNYSTKTYKTHQIVEKTINFRFYKIAAIIVVLISIGATILWIVNKPVKLEISDIAKASTSDSLRHNPNKQTKSNRINSEIHKEANYLADAYKPNPVLENEINNTTRDNQVINVKPSGEIIIKPGDKTVFKWENPSGDSVNLVILTNSGKEKIVVPVLNTYILKTKLSPGLYYWQLQSDSELLFTGKIKVNPL